MTFPALIILARETGDAAALVQVIVDATNDYTVTGRVGTYQKVKSEPVLFNVRVTTTALNVRNGPGVLGTLVLRTLKQWMTQPVYEARSGWLRISSAQEWISEKFCEKI